MRLSCYSPFLPPLAVLLLILPSTIVAAPSTATGKWLFPDSNYRPTYNYLDAVNCSWATNYPNAYLILWCGPPDFTSFTPCSNTSVPSTGSQTVSLDCNGAGACHAEIYAENKPTTPPETPFSTNSGAWYINQDSTLKPTTWSLATSPNTTSSSTTTSTSSATSVSSTAPTSAPTSTGKAAAPSGGLSTGSKAGIGVGVSMGVLLLAAVAFVIFRMRRRRQTDRGDSAQDMGSDTGLMAMKAADKAELKGMHETGGGEAHELDAMGGNIQEMRGSDMQAELDGTPAVGGTKGVRNMNGKN